MLRTFRTAAAVMLLPLLLSACGFGLRGVTYPLQPMPFGSLYLPGGSTVVGNLREILARDGQVTLPGKAAEAEAVLVIDGENYSKDILTINRSGKVNQYQLNYQVEAHVLKKGVPFGPPIEVRAHRDFVYSDQVLGKEQEENFLKDDMVKDVAEQLARRLAYLKPVKQDPFAALEGQPNAGTKP